MANKLVMLRLYGGEYVMGELDESGAPSILFTTLLNPRIFTFSPAFNGGMRAAFLPVCVFDEKKRESTQIHTSQIWLTIPEENLPKEIVNGYRSEISGIKLADSMPDVPDFGA